MAMKVFALGKEGKERMARKGREGQRGKDNEERKARKGREGQRGKEGKDSEKRTARKVWRRKEGLPYKELRWLGQRGREQ